MEWVETTGRTVDEAKDAALDQLGVAEDEAEFEIVEEVKSGLFGRVRRPARVRARVAPRRPRPKTERRRRGRSRGSGGDGSSTDERRRTKAAGKSAQKPAKKSAKKSTKKPAKEPAKKSTKESTKKAAKKPVERAATKPAKTSTRRSSDQPAPGRRSGESTSSPEEDTMTSDMTIQEQGDTTKVFLEGLLDAFGLDGDVAVHEVDEETVEVTVDGDDLGALIGAKGQTLQAIQDLARASVQCAADGPLHGRTRIDIGGYRLRRREALERFAHEQAAEVASAGVERALEAMSAADRKVVHDAINEVDGVTTSSEGEEPRRRVVISPA